VHDRGPALERKGDIAAFLTALEPNSVFFVDELHRLSRALEETFYPAMEDRKLPITVGQGAGARVVTLDLPPFTLVGRDHPRGPALDADARPLRHPAPPRALRPGGPRGDRHPLGAILDVELDPGRRPGDRRPQPRHAARGQPAAQARARLRRGADGWRGHRRGGRPGARPARGRRARPGPPGPRPLDAICARFDGGPVGLSTLAHAVGEEADTIEDVYEPYLLQKGLLKRTPRGRVATAAAYRHLGLQPTTLL
jgi:Holliday junction DNA helicase RuvB